MQQKVLICRRNTANKCKRNDATLHEIMDLDNNNYWFARTIK